VVLGPHTYNFSEAAALAVEAGAAVRVADMPQGVGEAVAIAIDATRHRDLVARCLGFLDAHRGAAAASARAIVRLLT
jgi:3-deoxy-D-manno-octulosonic-acid transferase